MQVCILPLMVYVRYGWPPRPCSGRWRSLSITETPDCLASCNPQLNAHFLNLNVQQIAQHNMHLTLQLCAQHHEHTSVCMHLHACVCVCSVFCKAWLITTHQTRHSAVVPVGAGAREDAWLTRAKTKRTRVCAREKNQKIICCAWHEEQHVLWTGWLTPMHRQQLLQVWYFLNVGSIV